MVSSGRGMFCGAGGDLKQSGMSESLPELLEEDVDKRISTLLDGPLAYNPSALWEVVRNTKFMKRLGGFFRCDPGEKGYFGHLPWTPRNCARYDY